MGHVNTISRVEDLNVFAKTGTVVGSSTWSETHVSGSSSGGGGFVYNGTGNISAPSVSINSSVTTKCRFFIRKDDGGEVEVTLSDESFSVRDGHRVTIAYAGDKASQNGWEMGLYNFNTKKREILHNRFAWVRGKRNLGGALFLCVIAFIIPNILLGGPLDSLGFILSVICVGFVLAHIVKMSNRRDKIDAAIRQSLDEHIDAAIAAHGTSPAPLAIVQAQGAAA